MDAENVVMTSAMVTLGSTVGGPLAQSGSFPKASTVVGGFFAMLLCSIIAEVNGRLGAGLSVAIAGTAFITYGLPAINSKTPQSKAKKQQVQKPNSSTPDIVRGTTIQNLAKNPFSH